MAAEKQQNSMKEIIRRFLKLCLPPEFRYTLRTCYNRLYYYGFSYKCPFCNSNLRIFIPGGYKFPVLMQKQVVGGGYRQNAHCPVCLSKDRERLLYLYLMFKTNIFKKEKEFKRVLHVSPEKIVEDKLKNYLDINYLTADLNSKNVMVKMDINSIPFPDNSFDVIICNHVLEHIVDDLKGMSELYRILKAGGWAILQVPISLSLEKTFEDFSIITEVDREEAFGQAHHVRIYAKDYKNRLEQAGFRVNIFRWSEEYRNFGGPHNRFGLNKKEGIYIVNKPINMSIN